MSTHPTGAAGARPREVPRPIEWEAEVIRTVEHGEEIVIRHYGFVHGRYHNVEEMMIALGEEIFAKVQMRR